MPLNLLYVIQNDEFGGGEHGFSQLVKGLDCKIFKVFVATTAKGRFYREIKDSGATVITIPFDADNQGKKYSTYPLSGGAG